MGHDYVPATCDLSVVDDVITISDEQAFATARMLLKAEGVFAGPSTGVAVAAAIQYCQNRTKPGRVVSFVYDTGNKYLSKLYNDDWLKAQGYDMERMLAEDTYV